MACRNLAPPVQIEGLKVLKVGPGGIRDEATEGSEGQSRRHDHGKVPLHMGLTA